MLLLSVPGLTLTAAAQEGPVTTDFSAVADTFVCTFPGLNGTGFFQFIQTERFGISLCHGFLRFELTSVFAGSTIINATLSLYQVAYAWTGPTEIMNLTAYGTAVGWTEVGLVWGVWDRDPRDHPVAAVTQATSNATTGTRVLWNMTPLVDNWVQDVLPNYGFRVGRSSGDGITNFASREAIETDRRPVLTVTYVRVVPGDPGVHPLAPHIVALGVPVVLFLAVTGMGIIIAVYFGLYAATNPELVGRKKRQKPTLRFRRRRR